MAAFIPYGDTGLFDDFIQGLDAACWETPLMRIGRVVDWTVFEPTLMKVLAPAKGPGGRPRFHPLLMFKILILQRLHGLADDSTSFQITDRSSFRAFLGLTGADVVPDGQTIADFRNQLMQAGLVETLFNDFLEHLRKEHGLALARQGVIADASFVEVPRQRNTRAQNAQIKAGEVPQEFKDNPAVGAHKDCDARWTKKDFTAFYGYKNHVKADVRDKLIIAAVVSAANVHDSQMVHQLIKPGDNVLYADSAYKGAAILEELTRKQVEGRINEHGTRSQPLSPEQKGSNKEKSRVRVRVEHIFAHMTGSMKAMVQRCVGLARNAACIHLSNLAYNLMRFEQIKRLGQGTPAGGSLALPA